MASAVCRLPSPVRSRLRRHLARLSAGHWDGGTRVKKLRGCAKPVLEARQDGGDRILFTLAHTAARDAIGTLPAHLQIWDVVRHDEVSRRATRINASAELKQATEAVETARDHSLSLVSERLLAEWVSLSVPIRSKFEPIARMAPPYFGAPAFNALLKGFQGLDMRQIDGGPVVAESAGVAEQDEAQALEAAKLLETVPALLAELERAKIKSEEILREPSGNTAPVVA